MEDPEDLTFSKLELCTYRHLQKVAKSMGLPSNVKKMHLIEMIRAKKYSSAEELNAIVVRIREERKRLTQVRKLSKRRKKRLQGMEISSTSNQSPPIHVTPRRSSEVEYPSRTQQILKYQQQTKTLLPTITKRTYGSDRVLRSFNNSMRPNYSIMNFNDAYLDAIQAQNASQQFAQERQYQLSMAFRRQMPINIGECMVQRQRPIVYRDGTSQVDFKDLNGGENTQLVPVSSSLNYPSPKPYRQRRVSGIYPLKPPETAYYMRSFGVRREDGRISKINAVIQKPLVGNLKPIDRNKLKGRNILNTIVRNIPLTEGSSTSQSIERNATPIYVRRNTLKHGPIELAHNQIQRPVAITVQDIVDYKIDRCSFSNSSTESAPETSARIERDNMDIIKRNKIDKIYGSSNTNRYAGGGNYDVETYNRYMERANGLENLNRNPERGNYGSGNHNTQPKRAILPSENLNRYPERVNHALENNRKPERGICGSENLNRYLERGNNGSENINKIPERGNHGSENINRNPERRNYGSENFNRHPERENYASENPRYTEATSYTSDNRSVYTENLNRYTGDLYATEQPNRHAESNNHATANLNRYTEIASYTPLLNPSLYTISSIRSLENPIRYFESANSGLQNRCFVTEQINRNTDIQNHRNDEDYPNMSALTDIDPNVQVTELSSKSSSYSVFYHKKRTEHMISQRPVMDTGAIVERLPRISDVFSQFHDPDERRSHPMLLQAGEEVPPCTTHTLLESIYNFRAQFLTNQPLGKINCTSTTTPETRCVFSNPVITSAVAHAPPALRNDYTHPCQQRDSEHHNVETETPRLYDYLKMAETERMDIACTEPNEAISSPVSSQATTCCTPELAQNVTIPEMVEDALELISQDGDYLERIGMDVRMQCILCDWAGPKLILEYHIRKEHTSLLVQQSESEWQSRTPLRWGADTRAWRCELALHGASVFVLLTACTAAHSFVAMLSKLPTVSDDGPKFCRITVYNKVTGEPHIWEGEVGDLPDTMPNHEECNGLKLDLTSLDLIPNSANLKFVNGELVVNPTAKVVLGHTELNNIDIVVHIKVFD